MRRKFAFLALAAFCSGNLPAADLHLNDLDYFESQGLSVLAYQNLFHEVFRDQKLGGIEIILHGERIATDGEVRLLPTPEQWDPVPRFTGRKHGAGGMIPGVVIIQPDFPELKDNWPFLWYENEYVVDAATSFILAANAADASSH